MLNGLRAAAAKDFFSFKDLRVFKAFKVFKGQSGGLLVAAVALLDVVVDFHLVAQYACESFDVIGGPCAG